MDNKDNQENKLPPSVVLQKPNRDVLSPLLSEYESCNAALQQQIDLYKVEHEKLRKELLELITENTDLSDKLKTVMGKKLSEEILLSPARRKESDMVANLQQQLSLNAQEKDSAIEMWHLALREVDNLEEALKSSHDNKHIDISQNKLLEIKKDFSEAIKMLESKLNTTRSMLAKERAMREEIKQKYDKSVEENVTLTATLTGRHKELEAALEAHCATARKLQEAEKKSGDLGMQVESLKAIESDLEEALAKCHEHIEDLVKKNLEAQEKVSESLKVVECALAEKEAAIISEAKMREENVRLQQIVTTIVDEAGMKVKEEIATIKQQYNDKLKMLLIDMKKLQDVSDEECKEKEKKLRKEIQERNVLEGQLEQIQKEAPATTNMLERRLSMVHEELSDVRRTNLQLAVDKEALRSEIDRIQESHTSEVRRLSQEYQALEQRMLLLQTQLEATTHSKNECEVIVEKLSEHLRIIEQERELIGKKGVQDWQQQQYQQDRQELLAQLQKIQKQSDATASELEHHLQKQLTLKMKYQKAMKSLTGKFEKRIQELRHESTSLKKENKVLEAKLCELQKALDTKKKSKKDDQNHVETLYSKR